MSYEGSDFARGLSNVLRPALEKMNINDDKILDETLSGYFPKLDKKESIVCGEIASCFFDNNLADDGSVISHCLEKKDIFYDIADVESTIKRLWEKGIVKFKTSFIPTSHFSNLICPFIALSLFGNVEEEIVYGWRKEFEYAVKGTFSAHKTESQQPN